MKLMRIQNSITTPWPTLGRFFDLGDNVDRLFETTPNELDCQSSVLNGWTPVTDITENKECVVVKVELPGIKKEDIVVTLHEGTLNITGERKSEKKVEGTGFCHSERFFGHFQRSVMLPTSVAAAEVKKADYKDGVLTITLPKTEEAKPKQIEVRVN